MLGGSQNTPILVVRNEEVVLFGEAQCITVQVHGPGKVGHGPESCTHRLSAGNGSRDASTASTLVVRQICTDL